LVKLYLLPVSMKKILLIIISIFFCYQIASANDNVNIISPGIKMGYVFGKYGGFTIGIEVSYVNWVKPFIGIGPTLNIDYFNKTLKIHLNAEVVSIVGGIAAGPTLVLKHGNWYWGYNFCLFAGLQYYLFFNYTNIYNFKFEEVGAFLKYPLINNAISLKSGPVELILPGERNCNLLPDLVLYTFDGSEII